MTKLWKLKSLRSSLLEARLGFADRCWVKHYISPDLATQSTQQHKRDDWKENNPILIQENMASSEAFPAADVQKELNPGTNKDFQVDPVSSNVATSKVIKEHKGEAERKEREKKDDALQNLKTAVIVSGIIVAVAGAVFAITKKLREK